MSFSHPTRIHWLAWLASIVVLSALVLENMRGYVSTAGGVRHGWPRQFMTRANFRVQEKDAPAWQASSTWPIDNAKVTEFHLGWFLFNLILTAALVCLTMLKVQLWTLKSKIRVQLSLKVVLMFPAICACGYLLWGNEIDAWLAALGKISFTAVVASIGVAWLALFDLLSLILYAAAKGRGEPPRDIMPNR